MRQLLFNIIQWWHNCRPKKSDLDMNVSYPESNVGPVDPHWYKAKQKKPVNEPRHVLD
jgi:hypothetical protein